MRFSLPSQYKYTAYKGRRPLQVDGWMVGYAQASTLMPLMHQISTTNADLAAMHSTSKLWMETINGISAKGAPDIHCCLRVECWRSPRLSVSILEIMRCRLMRVALLVLLAYKGQEYKSCN